MDIARLYLHFAEIDGIRDDCLEQVVNFTERAEEYFKEMSKK